MTGACDVSVRYKGINIEQERVCDDHPEKNFRKDPAVPSCSSIIRERNSRHSMKHEFFRKEYVRREVKVRGLAVYSLYDFRKKT